MFWGLLGTSSGIEIHMTSAKAIVVKYSPLNGMVWVWLHILLQDGQAGAYYWGPGTVCQSDRCGVPAYVWNQMEWFGFGYTSYYSMGRLVRIFGDLAAGLPIV